MSKIDMSKFNLQDIMKNVKAMINPTVIPEDAKKNPIGYRLSELNKIIASLSELHTKQADELARLNLALGELYQTISGKNSEEKNDQEGTSS